MRPVNKSIRERQAVLSNSSICLALLRGVAITTAVIAGTACSVGETSPESELAIEAADPDTGITARIQVGNEAIRVESHLADNVREILVEGDIVYAAWRITLPDTDITGSFAGQPFGTAETAESDQDPEHWRGLRDSRTGEVLAAVSLAALTPPEDARLAEHLEPLTHLRGYLDDLSAPPRPEGVIALACDMVVTHLANKSCGLPLGIYQCEYTWDARTNTVSTCGGNNCVQLYNNGSLVSSQCSTGRAAVSDYVKDNYGQGRHCRKSKHWTTYRAARWVERCFN
jgi:hypothetical protein